MPKAIPRGSWWCPDPTWRTFPWPVFDKVVDVFNNLDNWALLGVAHCVWEFGSLHVGLCCVSLLIMTVIIAISLHIVSNVERTVWGLVGLVKPCGLVHFGPRLGIKDNSLPIFLTRTKEHPKFDASHDEQVAKLPRVLATPGPL
jgi:hypothetical protein